MSVATTTIATPMHAARRSWPLVDEASRPRPSEPKDRPADRREAVGLFPTVAAAAEAIAALRRDGFDANEIGVLAAAAAAGAAAAITAGAIASVPALGAFWIAAGLAPSPNDDATRVAAGDDLLLGAGLAYWLVRHRAALPAMRLRGEVILLTVTTIDAGREAAALASLHRHGASGIRILAID